MEEYDIKEVNYDALKYLRKNTMIGPIALFKIESALKEAAIVQKYYREVEHQEIGLDRSVADSLEFNIRLKAMERKMFNLWEKYGDGIPLEEFTYDAVMAEANKYKENTIRK